MNYIEKINIVFNYYKELDCILARLDDLKKKEPAIRIEEEKIKQRLRKGKNGWSFYIVQSDFHHFEIQANKHEDLNSKYITFYFEDGSLKVINEGSYSEEVGEAMGSLNLLLKEVFYIFCS